MGHQVKWIEENLGITRNALRYFESQGLIPENVGGKYREYSDKEVNKIWLIKRLQGIGYSAKEISDIFTHEDYDMKASLDKKICELEKKRKDIDDSLGYARQIRLTGQLPVGSNKIGELTCEEVQNQAVKEWNVNNNPTLEKMERFMDDYNKSPQEDCESETLTENDPNDLLDLIYQLFQAISPTKASTYSVLLSQLIKRKDLGAKDTEVQLLIKMLCENMVESDQNCANIDSKRYCKEIAYLYQFGSIGENNQKIYGKETCDFISDACAIHGGYKDFIDLLEKEENVDLSKERQANG